MNILRLAFLRKKAKLTEKMTDFYRKNTIGIGFLMRIQWVSYRQQRGFAAKAALCIRYVGYQRIGGGDHCVQRQGSARKHSGRSLRILYGDGLGR